MSRRWLEIVLNETIIDNGLTAGGQEEDVANFNIKNLNAHVVQNADQIHNQDAIIQQLQVSPKVKAELQVLLAKIAILTESGVVSHEIGHELRSSIVTAAEEAATSAPRQHRLIAALNRTKEIAAGLTATVGIAEAVDNVIKTLWGGS